MGKRAIFEPRLDCNAHSHGRQGINPEIMLRRLGALSSDQRLAIFELLAKSGAKGLCVRDIQSALDLKPATLTFHLCILEQAELVHARREGRYTFYAPKFRSMNDVISYLVMNCTYSESMP